MIKVSIRLEKNPSARKILQGSVSLAKELNNVIEQLSSGGHRVDPSTWPKEITTTSLLTDKAQHYFEDLSKLRKLVENQLAGDGYITKEQHCLSLLEEIPEQPKRIILLGTTNLRTIVQKKLNILASSGSRIEHSFALQKKNQNTLTRQVVLSLHFGKRKK